MADHSDHEREVADLKARLAAAEAARDAKPIKVDVGGAPSPGGGFRGGFFGCFGVLAAIVALFVVLFAIGKCSQSVVGNATNAATTDADSVNSAATAAAAANTWVYAQEADPLHDVKTKTACVTSSDQVNLDFPYHNTDAQLCIRQRPGAAADAYVSLNGGGQILCGIEECTIHIRFDKGAIQGFPATGAADNSTNIIFIRRASALAAALKRASSTVVQLNLYQAGQQTLTFHTTGLKWP